MVLADERAHFEQGRAIKCAIKLRSVERSVSFGYGIMIIISNSTFCALQHLNTLINNYEN